MKILIIGGSGFLSGTLARESVRAGHEVWVVTRGNKALPQGVRAIQADRQNRPAFAAAIQNAGTAWDLCVDCIGYDLEDARQDIEVFKRLAQHVVFISTDFVLDPARRRLPLTEEFAQFQTAGYGAKKRACERAFFEAGTALKWTLLRPCHIYGPGSQLGCLPLHGRDPELLRKLRGGEILKLVGGGHFLQQPILARDLSEMILSCAGNAKTFGEAYLAAGPDIIESREYYRIIADVLGVELRIEEVSAAAYLAEHADAAPFLCHRIYDLSKARQHGLKMPRTPIEEGLREHIAALAGTD